MRLLRLLLAVALLPGTFAGGWIAGRTGLMAPAADPATLSDAERAFAARMTNVALVGRFSVNGREDRSAVPDRYDISTVEKIGDDLWRFTVRMRDSGHPAVPVTVPMRWAGTTP